MPVVEVDPDELRRLTGHDEKDDAALRSDLFALGLEYEGETEDGAFQLELAPDRLDRLSVEGVARSLRYQYGDDRGVAVPNTNAPDWTYVVEEAVPKARPYVTGAVIRGASLSEAELQSLLQLQEKLHATMGRDRAKGAIGIHDLTMLKGRTAAEDGSNSITYTGIDPDGDTFVPLDSEAELTPGEVLTEHPVGDKYAPLVEDYDRMPAIYDAIGLFSFPPVINGRRTEVETESRDLLVELTGTDQWTIDHMCNIICYALDARGATIERVTVDYPDRELERPDFTVEHKTVTHDRIEGILGIELGTDQVVDLVERSGLDIEPTGADAYEVGIPPYRVDVLHPLDVIDDLGRAYGFNDLQPRYPDVSTVGGRHERSRLERAAREVLVGLGFEDLLNFYLIGEAPNYDRMGIAPDFEGMGGGDPARITEPYSTDYAMVRTWALPSLLLVLEHNTHRAYPQDLAEIGLAARVDPETPTGVAEWRTVASVLARTDASYEDAKGRLQGLVKRFDADLETPPTDHPTFIDGRAADVVLDGDLAGVIGEIDPAVLVEHDLELPVAAFELRLDALD
jgi:phenylalanyl-tRNA synthetase beta chain